MFPFITGHGVENATQETLEMEGQDVLFGFKKMTEVHPLENGKTESGHHPPVLFFSYNKQGFS